MAFVHRLGQIQTGLLLALAYIFVIGPTALFLRVLGRRDLLDVRAKKATTFAYQKHAIPTDRERCERQF
ncbi:MAG TPA: hypothetical protein VGK30_21335 [Candidatus Binatia bacterium]|jgi:hypothetical protein